MLAEAAGFALLAAISPPALLVMAVFPGSAEPRRNALMYTGAAVAMTVTAALASAGLGRYPPVCAVHATGTPRRALG